ncbi:hypothetical protein HK096_004459, partial [Nowakowskiella sp. JEL0078]
VYDVTSFLLEHPGGKKVLLKVAGQDATKQFDQFHTPAILQQWHPKLFKGDVSGAVSSSSTSSSTESAELYPIAQEGLQEGESFGLGLPFGDPYWYSDWHSPYYNDSHRRLRSFMRSFVEKEIMPFCFEWDEKKAIPKSLFEKAGRVGILAGVCGAPYSPYAPCAPPAGIRPEEFDAFHELVICDELARCGSGGVLWGLIGGLGIGLPPVLNFASKDLAKRIAPGCLDGSKNICLAITEPYAGSDVANIKAEAKKTEDGKYYILNGEKKWITNVACRTGGPGMNGISLLLVEKSMPGVTTRQMPCMGVWASGTSYITFEDVKVPVENIIGKENKGFKAIMHNFNHERMGIVIQATRFARVCFSESLAYAHKRRTFGKKLVEHPVIRQKLANMARQIEATHSWMENLIYQSTKMDHGMQMLKLGGPIALLKAQSTQTFEYCAREAAQVFGGNSYTRGGVGEKVERLYREVRAYAIPGGSEEIMLDLGIRQSIKVAHFMTSTDEQQSLPSFLLENSSYRSRAKRLLKLVNELRDAGAAIDLDLPTVVVAGNQSAGKSSLLEGICGIVLPRGDGTCTRSVTEVRLSEPESSDSALKTVPSVISSPDSVNNWSCSIKLRFEFDSHGRTLSKPREIAFGPEITNQSELELWVRRAQKVLLNPSYDPQKYLDIKFDNSAAARDKDARSNELKFSRNVVCLDVRNAGVNLTLIDLPGIIRSVDHRDDAQNIDMIQDLVKSYIKKDRAIVVATITCKDEIENQAVVNWAKEYDAYGLRTIGVLTKPDTIEAATHDRWVSILLGQHYHLNLGYWMVRNPNKVELESNISFAEARKKESEFFSTTLPWSSLQAQMDRFGTENLRNELSRQLTMLSDTALPDMKKKTEEAIQLNANELSKLPPQMSDNGRIELLQMIRGFCTLVNNNILAQQEFKTFYQKVRVHFETFKEQILNTRPVFVFDKTKIPGSLSHAAINGASSLMPSLPNLLPSFLSGLDDSKRKDSLRGKSPEKNGVTYSLQGQTLTEHGEILDVKKPITMSDIRKVIDSQKGREMHGYSPYGAFAFIVTSFQQEWPKHSVQCLSSVSNELHLLIAKLTDECFGRFSNLQGQMRFTVQVFQSELYRSTLESLNHLIQMERRSPFTMGSDEFVRLKNDALSDFKALYEVSRTNAPTSSIATPPQRPETVNRALAALAEAGYTGLTGRDLLRLRDSGSEVDEALQVMAAADAYFTVASKRYLDNVPMTADYGFLARFGDTAEKEIVSRLGVLDKDAESIAYLLQEDRVVTEKRKGLEETRVRLEKIVSPEKHFEIQMLLSLLKHVSKTSKKFHALLFLTVVLHISSMPLVHNAKFLWYIFYAKYFLERPKSAKTITLPQSVSSSKTTTLQLRDPFFTDFTSFRVWFDDLDYNLHMNNSRYPYRLDLVRSQYGVQFFHSSARDVKLEEFYIANGGTTFFFRREIRPLQYFRVQTRLLSWNTKWIFAEHRFLIRGVDKGDKKIEVDDIVNKDIPKGWVLACFAISKLVGKYLDRKTVPVEDLLVKYGYLGRVGTQEDYELDTNAYDALANEVKAHNEWVEERRAKGWEIAKRILDVEQLGV